MNASEWALFSVTGSYLNKNRSFSVSILNKKNRIMSKKKVFFLQKKEEILKFEDEQQRKEKKNKDYVYTYIAVRISCQCCRTFPDWHTSYKEIHRHPKRNENLLL